MNYKIWIVTGYTRSLKPFKMEVELGRLSDRYDVMNYLKRKSDYYLIREVTSIREK